MARPLHLPERFLHTGATDADSASSHDGDLVRQAVQLATGASPGQGTLRVAAEAAAPGLLATVVLRHRKTGAIARYSISSEWLPVLLELNRSRDPLGRYEAVMAADQLIRVEQ